MSGILTDAALEGFKQHTERTIDRAQYTIDGVTRSAIIHRRERLADGRVAVYFSITPGVGSNVTIQEVKLYNTRGELWAAKSESIKIHGLQEGVLYRFTFEFREV